MANVKFEFVKEKTGIKGLMMTVQPLSIVVKTRVVTNILWGRKSAQSGLYVSPDPKQCG